MTPQQRGGPPHNQSRNGYTSPNGMSTPGGPKPYGAPGMMVQYGDIPQHHQMVLNQGQNPQQQHQQQQQIVLQGGQGQQLMQFADGNYMPVVIGNQGQNVMMNMPVENFQPSQGVVESQTQAPQQIAYHTQQTSSQTTSQTQQPQTQGQFSSDTETAPQNGLQSYQIQGNIPQQYAGQSNGAPQNGAIGVGVPVPGMK